MRAFVTGGGGFIGSFLCEKLSRESWTIKILDIEKQSNSNIRPDNNKVEYVVGDILDYTTVSEAISDADLVIHLAAKHRFFGISEDEFYRVNVNGTKTILDAMTQRGIKNIIFYSSVAVYGDQHNPTDEKTIPCPNTPYGVTKLEAERLVNKWVSESVDRNALIIRPTVVFGPKNKGNMYRLIRQIDRRLFVPIGRGENIKSVAYVENLVDATLFLMNKGFKNIDIYNYADEPHKSFKEIVDLIYSNLGRSIHTFYLPAQLILAGLMPFDFISKMIGKDLPVTAAIRKMNKSTYHSARKIRDVGFRQKDSLEAGLKRMIEWYISNKNNREEKITCKEVEE